ncbi:MAG: hypothetical protein LBE32_00350 [Burkholderiales bacterium]|jgi:hypothetical protein|nr:hypothetical protein [Burkholderiales bacterium]
MRKPVHLERTGGKSPRQRIWEALKRKRESVSIIAIAADADIDRGTVRNYVKALALGGFIELVESHKRPDYSAYRLIRDVGVDAPRLRPDGTTSTFGDHQAAMWRTMRILRCDFTATELAGAASTDDCNVSIDSARLYARHLCAAGYLQKVGVRAEACFALKPSRDTGPRAPIVGRTRIVYDPNLGKIVWHEEVEP